MSSVLGAAVGRGVTREKILIQKPRIELLLIVVMNGGRLSLITPFSFSHGSISGAKEKCIDFSLTYLPRLLFWEKVERVG